MKRKITLSIALVLSVVLLSLMSSDSSVQAAREFRADTGIVSLGANQILRLTVAEQDDPFLFDAAGIRYAGGICNSEGVCKHTVASQTSNRIRLMPGEAASFDIPGTGNWVRGIVTSNRRMVVNAQIIDVETGNVDAIIAILIGL